MADTLRYIDEALDLGRRELDLLAVGDVEEAQLLAERRAGLIAQASASESPLETMLELREKLVRLQSLQGRITEEAKRLHGLLKSDLLKMRQQTNRMGGYRAAVTSTPSASMYISRQG